VEVRVVTATTRPASYTGLEQLVELIGNQLSNAEVLELVDGADITPEERRRLLDRHAQLEPEPGLHRPPAERRTTPVAATNGHRPVQEGTPTPPASAAAQNADAERQLDGAILLAGQHGLDHSRAVIGAVRAVGLQADAFYYHRHGHIYAAAIALDERDEPAEPTLVAAELDRRGLLADVGGLPALYGLAAEAPATANAAHHARIVLELAQARAWAWVSAEVADAARRGSPPDPALREQIGRLLEHQAAEGEPVAAAPVEAHTHGHVLTMQVAAERYLVDGLIPIGAVGTIAGVPETHKSWLAHAIATRVAAGAGEILGHPITQAGRVAYAWQDDSTAAETERVQLFDRTHPAPPDLSLWWLLNPGLELPRDLPRLRATVHALELDLLILDSFYNFLTGADLKAEDAERVVAQLKREISDPTGCTVLVVDHMPWATDTNRQRLRAYGGVHKNAATRFGIYIDAVAKTLSIEARGNNIRGFNKTPAYWNPDTLELRLVEQTDHDAKVEERAERVREYLESHPGAHSKTAIRKAVGGRGEITDQALELLKERDITIPLSRDGGTASDGQGATGGWIASIHAASHPSATLSLLDGTGSDSPPAGQTTTTPVPSPIGGQGYVGTGSADVDEAELERLQALAQEMNP
jgi:hypothetical protein